MTNKEKQLRKELIKKRLFKIIHIICYILSALFILICIIGGVKSCKDNSKVKQVNNQLRLPRKLNNFDLNAYPYVYTLRSFGSTVTIDTVAQNSFANGTIDVNITYTTSQPTVYVTVLDLDNAFISFNGEFYKFDNIYATYNTISYEVPNLGTRYLYRLYHIVVVYYDDDGYSRSVTFAYNYTDNVSDYVFDFWSDGEVKVFASDDEINNNFFNFFFQRGDVINFIFNKNFNYNAPIGLTTSNPFGSSISIAPETVIGGIYRFRYDVGYFVSNNTLYDQIVIDYLNAGACTFKFDNNYYSNGTSDELSYFALGYRRSSDGLIDFINYRDSSVYSSSTQVPTTYFLNSSTWVNDSFRFVAFLNPLSDSLNIKVNAFNNNNQDYYTGNIYYDGYDVFTLLSFAFTSLGNFWSLAILPGISIGVLFFLPAVVGVIIAIVHLLRK